MDDNILQEQQSDKVQFRSCKLKYLRAENKLLTIQLTTVCRLVDLHKKILNLIVKKDEDGKYDEAEAQKLFQSGSQLLQECYQQCQEFLSKKDLFPQQEQGMITPAFFMELVINFQKTIAELKNKVHHRETLLQELEADRNHPKRRKNQPQSRAMIKAIETYDIYPILVEKCKSQIQNLKLQKNKLELGGEISQSQNKTIPFTQMNPNHFQADKTMKKIPKTNTAAHIVDQTRTDKTMPTSTSLTPFEKLVLVYKKKKLFNQILQNKVINIKNKIHEKQVHNQLLKNRIQRETWEINHPMVHNIEQEGDVTYLSILNNTMKANNLDFSVDISKVYPSLNKDEEEIHDRKYVDNILQGIMEEEPTERRLDQNQNGLVYEQCIQVDD